MRGVGRALGKLTALGPADAARIRIAVATIVVTLAPRVDAVIVVRRTAQPDIVWRSERDRWSPELTGATLEMLLAKARGAGFAVTNDADLLALPDVDFVA